MLDKVRLKKNSVKSDSVTFATRKTAPVEACINPYLPFAGTDGKNYLIGYEARLNTTTNCYAYAAGWRYPASDKYNDYVPGFLTGKPYSFENIAELVKGDFEAVGREVYEIVYDIPEILPEGEGYWIKFVHCPDNGDEGIHFMRKDKKSGRWIHKMGWEMPPKVCVRNLEFRDKKEALFDMPQMQGVPRELAESMLQMMFPREMYTGVVLAKSELETCDSAGYIAFNEDDEILNYDAVWAMRISEP